MGCCGSGKRQVLNPPSRAAVQQLAKGMVTRAGNPTPSVPMMPPPPPPKAMTPPSPMVPFPMKAPPAAGKTTLSIQTKHLTCRHCGAGAEIQKRYSANLRRYFDVIYCPVCRRDA